MRMYHIQTEFSYNCCANELIKFIKILKNHIYYFDPTSSIYKILRINSL
jgi:hypothetical protein